MSAIAPSPPDTPNTDGFMGVKLRRPALGSYSMDGYLEDLESIVFAIMIEKNVTVDHLDEVLQRAKERGVDMTQWGASGFQFLAWPTAPDGFARHPPVRGEGNRQILGVRHPSTH